MSRFRQMLSRISSLCPLAAANPRRVWRARAFALAFGASLLLATPDAHALTKEDVVNMSNIGVADSVIISAIQASGTMFTLRAQDIIELTNAGVSQKVIEAMQKTSGAAAPAAGSTEAPPVRPPPIRTPPTRPVEPETPEEDPGEPDLPPTRTEPETPSARPKATDPSRTQGAGSPAAGQGARPAVNRVKPLPSDVKTLKERYRQTKYNTTADMAFELLTGPNRERFVDHRSTIYFYLGLALEKMELHHAAHDIFLTVARNGPEDENYSRALARLNETSKRLKEFDGFAGVLEGASTTDLPRAARSTLLYLIGLRHYEQEDYELARRAIEGVEENTAVWPQAIFLDGMSLFRQGNNKEAARRFKKLVEAPDLLGTQEDIQEIKDLALLNMARIYYRTENFETARRLYDQIPRTSVWWSQALYEGAYSDFWLGDYNTTLGNVMTLESPFMKGRIFMPEARVLRALTLFNLCGYDRVQEEVKLFQGEYKPMRDRIRKFLDAYRMVLNPGAPGWEEGKAAALATEAFGSLYDSASKRKATGIPEEVLVALERPRDFTNRLHHLEMIKREVYEISEGKVRRKGTLLGKTLLKKLEDDRQILRSEAGKYMLEQLGRIEKELSGLIGQSDIILFEVVNAQKEEYEEKFRNPEKIETYDRLELSYATESKNIFWPFTGEYWEDELGYYRFMETGACKAKGAE